MHSLLNLKRNVKGQFFVLTAVAIVAILFFVGKWLDVSTQSDTSYIVLSQESFIFDNIFEKTTDVIKNSENCDNLNYNLQEYKSFISGIALEKNYKLRFDYNVPSCSDTIGATNTISFNMRIQSETSDLSKDFSLKCMMASIGCIIVP